LLKCSITDLDCVSVQNVVVVADHDNIPGSSIESVICCGGDPAIDGAVDKLSPTIVRRPGPKYFSDTQAGRPIIHDDALPVLR
jgi:hypothetical protein